MTSDRKLQPPPPDYDPAAPLTDEEIKRLRPAAELFAQYGIPMPKSPGRPKAEKTKVAVTMRMDEDVVSYFKRSGPGWQTRMHPVLATEARKAGARKKSA
jgi:uncharacterized protein (DUF4415 family)